MLTRAAKILKLAISDTETALDKSCTEKNKKDPYEFEQDDSSSGSRTLMISPSVSSECTSNNLRIDKSTIEEFYRHNSNHTNSKDVVLQLDVSPDISMQEKIYYYLQSMPSAVQNDCNEETTNLKENTKDDEIDRENVRNDISIKNDSQVNFKELSAKKNYSTSESEPVTSGSEFLPSEEDHSDSGTTHSEANSEVCLESNKENEYCAPIIKNSRAVNRGSTYEACAKPPNNAQKDLCPFCFEEVGHFSRHLIRKHSDEEIVKKIIEMPEKSTSRRNAIIVLRRKGNLVLQREKNILKPVRKPVGINKDKVDHINYSVCVNCLGFIKSTYLWRHRKHCKVNTEHFPKKFGHRTESQTFLVSTGLLENFLNKTRLMGVFKIMRADNVGFIARSDPLICLYGESLLGKHKRKQMYIVVSQKMRIMAKLLLGLRASTTVNNFLDVLKPEMYQYILAATKVIGGYDSKILSFKTPSIPLHLGTDLKHMCQVAKKAITIKDALIRQIKSREEKKTEISQLHEMIVSHWCNDISSLANKVLNEKKIDKPKLLPTAEDVSKFNNYTSTLASESYNKIINNENIEANYDMLVKCTLALLLLFNRRRIGEIQFLDIASYERPSEYTNQEEMLTCLTEFERYLCGMFKRVVVFGKGSKPVPILFSKKTQKYTYTIIDIRHTTNIVPKDNKYIFATSGSSRWINGTAVIQNLASQCGAKRPELLRSTRFRKQIATILQLMNFEKDELHQVAKFMGHTEKTHLEFYRLTENTYQTAKVAKILLLMESGKGAEFKGKSLNDITLDDELFSEDVIDNSNLQPSSSGVQQENEIIEHETEVLETEKAIKKTSSGRVKWESHQKEIVLKRFKNHIKTKTAPKKNECMQLIHDYPEVFVQNDWVRIKTLVYNTYRNK